MYLKRFLIDRRLMEYSHEHMDRMALRIKSLPFKMPNLDGPNEMSWRDMDHPELKHSFLYYIGKAVGKVSIAPANIAQHYLTSTKNQK